MALPTDRWRSLIETVCADTPPVPADVLEAMVIVESSGDPNARSASNAIGLGQIIPKWHRDLIATVAIEIAGKMTSYEAALLNPDVNLRVAARHLHWCHSACGSWETAVAKYHSGQCHPPTDFVDGQGTSTVYHLVKFRDALQQVRSDRNQNGESTMPTVAEARKGRKVMFEMGHRNFTGGGAYREKSWTPKPVWMLRDELIRRGYPDPVVFVNERDDGGTDPNMLGGHLDLVGQNAVRVDRERGPFMLYLSWHYDGTGYAPGLHVIPPGSHENRHLRAAGNGGRYDGELLSGNGLDLKMARVIGQHVAAKTHGLGLRTRGVIEPGIMAEWQTGVGGNGWRLSELHETLPIRGHCVRLVLECGSIASTSNGPWMWDEDNLRDYVLAIADAIDEYAGIEEPAENPEVPDVPPAPDPGVDDPDYADPAPWPSDLDITEFEIAPGTDAPQRTSKVLQDGTVVVAVNDMLRAIRDTPRLSRGYQGAPQSGPMIEEHEVFPAIIWFRNPNGWACYGTTWRTRVAAEDCEIISDRVDNA